MKVGDVQTQSKSYPTNNGFNRIELVQNVIFTKAICMQYVFINSENQLRGE